MESIAVVVSDVRDIARDIRMFTLSSASAAPLPAFAAGAHVDVLLANGMTRQYSLLNLPDGADRYQLAVAREPDGRGGSSFMHDALMIGDHLSISPPRCHFALVEDAPHSVFVAGGIGITPIWAMVQRLIAIGRPWHLHYAARTRAHAGLLGPIERAAASAGGRLATYFNLEGDPLMDIGAIVAAAPGGSHFYGCGPPGLLDAFRAGCADMPDDRVHWEQFVAAAPAARDGGYTVELRRSGLEIAVAPGQSILDALTAAGMRATYSCREGVCGSCETAVLAGVPDHRDAILTDAERAAGATMMICCSGSKSARLVLDM